MQPINYNQLVPQNLHQMMKNRMRSLQKNHHLPLALLGSARLISSSTYRQNLLGCLVLVVSHRHLLSLVARETVMEMEGAIVVAGEATEMEEEPEVVVCSPVVRMVQQ